MKEKTVEFALPGGSISLLIDMYGRTRCFLKAGGTESYLGTGLIEMIASVAGRAGKSHDRAFTLPLEGGGAMVFSPQDGAMTVEFSGKDSRPLTSVTIDEESFRRWCAVLRDEGPAGGSAGERG